MSVLIDTNVLVDFIAVRSPFYADALRIIDACDRKILHGCIAAHSVPNIYYILRKELPPQTRKDILSALCEILAVEALSKDVITNALSDTGFTDFEDCLQDQCASAFRADYIITRNTDDFTCSSVPAITPSAFCERFLNNPERSNPS